MIIWLGKTAKELKELKDAGEDIKIIYILKEIATQEYFFKILSRAVTYNGEIKIRHQAISLTPINYANESKEILKTLEIYNLIDA